MSLGDLIFLFCVAAGAAAVLGAAVQFLRGSHRAARRQLAGVGVCVALYATILIATSVLAPQTVIPPGAQRCWDDWCLTVERAERTEVIPPGIAADADHDLLVLTLRIASRARRVPQRESGVRLFILDASGTRYDTDSSAQQAMLASGTAGDSIGTVLAPGASFVHHEVFRVPRTATGLGLGKDAPGPVAVIIGDEGSLLHKRTVQRLSDEARSARSRAE